MKKKLFRIISVFLSVLMLCQLLPLAVFAAELKRDDALTAQTTPSLSEEAAPQTAEDGEAEILGELTEKREANVKYFKMSDGSYSAYVYAQNVHYEENGRFLDIDNTLKSVTVGGKAYYENTAGAMQIRLPEALGSSEKVEVSAKGHTLSWQLEGAAASISGTALQPKSASTLLSERNVALSRATTKQEAAAAKNSYFTTLSKVKSAVLYENVAADFSLQYDLVGDTLKESLVLNKPAAQSSYSFRITATDTTPSLQADGSVLFLDEKSNVIFTLAAPWMWDAAEQYSSDIEVKLERVRDGYLYTLTPDAAWLRDSARQYPVTIDPTVTTEQNAAVIKDTTGVAASRNSTLANRLEGSGNITTLKVGKLGGYQTNAYIYVQMPAIPDSARLINAQLALTMYRGDSATSSSDLTVGVYEITSFWNETNFHENSVLYQESLPSTNLYPLDYFTVNDASATTHGSHYYLDITKAAQKWATGSSVNHGVALSAVYLPSSEQYVSFF
ncbi:MAG: DNRLRE domain-containing protein, partial [Clostridia bacterium]|nr:DNRLRE domain-containing protein [Clostridia bacterium]